MPDAILLKPGPLSADEIEVMRKHPVVGERICAPLKNVSALCFRLFVTITKGMTALAIPTVCVASKFPLTAAILQLADVYDALTTDRPYRNA